ncbi:hypothetical protein BUALT_Bualt01G0099300 [Buddleja alternifolia]|uniref:DDE Tnp4 domain-containing protein n=1 Tax=Buddleja alternifolia TaxID=168488 RepID=A0AAV6YCU5_9LAMI|nr:hypothetical protein BUALT_Bualt01G0099300 [Buddleja alternifolia]
MHDLVNFTDETCINNLRMSRNAFGRLCYLLENNGGLVNTRNVTVCEQVAIFLTGCLGALDGTYIPLRVAQKDKALYRNKKADVSINVLVVCNKNMNYVYMLCGWKGSAADSRVLKDAITRDNDFRIPDEKYYLCDSGYTNGEGFLAPYRAVRYHIQEWNSHRTPPQNSHELFNYVHARARNVIERASMAASSSRMRGGAANLSTVEELQNNVNANQTGKDNKDGGDYVPVFNNVQFDEVQSMSFSHANTGGSSKSASKRKRKVVDENDDRFIDLMSLFCDKTNERLGDISRRIGYEHDASSSRKAVFEALGNLGSSLDMEGMILVSHLIVKDTKNMDIFFSFPNDGRKTMVHIILQGKFPSISGF